MIPRAAVDLILLVRASQNGVGDETVPDTRLVERCRRAQDEDAYTLLARRHRRQALHTAAAVLGPALQHEAEDVAQDAFVRAFERLDTLKAPDRFGAWVCRLAFNLAIDIRRLARARLPHVEAETASLVAQNDAPDDLVIVSDQDRQLRVAVDALPDTTRAVLHMHYWLDYRVDEIAEILGMPSGSVKSHLHRGRSRLAARLKEP